MLSTYILLNQQSKTILNKSPYQLYYRLFLKYKDLKLDQQNSLYQNIN